MKGYIRLRDLEAIAVDQPDIPKIMVESYGFKNSGVFRDTIMSAREIPITSRLSLEQLWKSGENNMKHSWAMDMFSIYSFSKWCTSHGYH